MIYYEVYDLEDIRFYYFEDQLEFSDHNLEKLNVSFKIILDLLKSKGITFFSLNEPVILGDSIVFPSGYLSLGDILVYFKGEVFKLPYGFKKGVFQIRTSKIINTTKVNKNIIKIELKYTDDENENVEFDYDALPFIKINSNYNITKQYSEEDRLLLEVPIHTHIISEISGLQNALDGKANVSHTHNISDVNNLQDQLNSKSNIGHIHNISDINNLQTELDNKANISHIHQIYDIQNLQVELDGKANTIHSHEISDINNLQLNLDSKVNLSQVIRIDANQITNDLEKRTFLSNLNAYVQLSNLPTTSINTNGNVVVLGVNPQIPYSGRFLIEINLVFQVVFKKDRRNKLYIEFSLQSSELNSTKFIDNFYDYYSYNINQVLSFERKFLFMHNFTGSDVLTLSLRNITANNIQSIDLLEGYVLIINY
ncbi:MAG: hypothetical protein KatS3mg068_1527 [Candidatus Sericytochromatia bacterium]|nr:MAG: hypothetical protein KatS3mg068_1527 [Candidatus Sericytochromatia bacterium]